MTNLRKPEEATHHLQCSHCQGRSVNYYKMRCILLGKTKAGKAKVLVFGERNWRGRDHVQKVRYVDEDRLSIMPYQLDPTSEPTLPIKLANRAGMTHLTSIK